MSCNSGGVFSLCALGITTAIFPASVAESPIVNLDGMTAVTLDATWSGGTGGTSVLAIVQTSFDEGTTWRDIARFEFTTTGAVKQCNLSGLLSKGITAYSALAAEGVTDGVLGSELRAVVSSVGVFTGAGGVLSIRAAVR